jgi:TolA-binding protein
LVIFVLLGWATLSGVAQPPAKPPAPPPAKPAAPPTPTKSSTEAFKEAQDLYSDGNWAAALVAFQNFSKLHPFSSAAPDAIYYQGWCWANQARYQEAINVFQQLITRWTNNVLIPEALLKQSECYRELKDYKKALELAQRFQQQYPRHELLPQAMLGEAWAQFKTGNTPQAKAIIRTVQLKFSSNPEAALNALFLLGQVLTEEKDYKAANAVYRQISRMRTNPRATEALYLAGEAMFARGETLLRDDKPDDARQSFRDAISYFKGVRSKTTLVRAVERDIAEWNARKGSVIAERGLPAWERGAEALKRLLAQTKEKQDLRVLAMFRVANCYQQLDMPEEASVVYQFLKDTYPDDRATEQIWFGLIQTLTQRGQLEKANQLSEEFKVKFPKSGGAESVELLQAESLFGQKRYKEALPAYERARAGAKDPQIIETIEFRIATCHFNLDDFEKARADFAAFAEKRPDSKIRPDALFLLGLTYYQIADQAADPKVAQPNLEAAVKAYEEVRAKYPQSDKTPLSTFRLGYLYSFLGAFDPANYDKAIAAFQEFLTKWPQQTEAAEAMYQIARNHISAQRLPEAIAAFQAVIEKYPDHDLAPFSALEIAGAYHALGKPAEKIAAFRAFVQKYPAHPKVGDALYAVASELEAQKKPDEAILVYREILSRALSQPDLPEAERDAAIGAQLRITALLSQKLEPKLVVADCEAVLNRFAGNPVAARALVGQIADVYRKNRLYAEGYAKLDELTQKYQLNVPIRHATLISVIELALTEKDLNKASATVARLLADPDRRQLPLTGLAAIGNAALRTERYAQAKEYFEKVVSGATDEPRLRAMAHLGLGQALLGLKQYEAAQAALESALQDPSIPRPEAELALAKVHEAKNQTEKAVELYSRVMSTSKGDVQFESAYRLGNIFFQMVSPDAAKMKDNKKTALAYYARLLLAPASPMSEEAFFRASECHEALGNLPQACANFRSYLQRFPNGRFVAEAKTKADKLCAPRTP